MSNKPRFSFDPQMCRQCKGLCCLGHPGAWVDPKRFMSSFFPQRQIEPEQFQQRLNDFSLTVRDYDGVPVPVPVGSDSGCSLLGSSGCRLTPEQRPCQCLALIPSIDTLLAGEIHCRLPAGFSYAEVRSQWQAFWKTSATHGKNTQSMSRSVNDDTVD